MKLIKNIDDNYKRWRTCNECGGEVEDLVEIGEEPDYESATAIVCKSCIEKALLLFS